MIYKIQAMKASRKKIAIVAGAVIAVLLTLTITTPYLFKDNKRDTERGWQEHKRARQVQ